MSGTASDSDGLRFLFRFGTAEFDQSRFELKVDGAVVDADRRPLELLNLLLIHLGEVITRDELYETLWAEEDVGEGAIANAVSRLRKHLGKDNAAFIVTRPRVGYSFVGKVERIGQNQPLQSAVSLQPGDPVPGRADYQLETLMSVSGNQNREVWKARSVQGDTRHVFKFSRQAEGLRQLKREYTVSELLSKVPGTRNAVAIVCGRNFEQPPFYVEYPYLGPDLLKWAEEGDRLKSMSRDERITLFLQVADTLSAAHNLGVLHKDIKPANVLIKATDNGYKAVLTDFGSSHLMQSQVLVEHGVSPLGMSVTFDTSPSTTGGTLLYLAPEVWAGESPSIRSDIYALGIMLYQMLSGDLRQGIPPDWRERLNDELLAEDIQAATSSDVSGRLPSVAELSERLRSLNERRQKAEVAAQKEAEILAAKDALSRARTRRPWLIAASLSLITGLLVSLTLYQQAESARKEAETQVARTETINQFWQDEIIQSGNPYAKDQASITDVLQSASEKVAEVFKDDPATAGSIYESLGNAFAGLSNYEMALKNKNNAYDEFVKSYGADSKEAWLIKLKNLQTHNSFRKFEFVEQALNEFETTALYKGNKKDLLTFYFLSAKADLYYNKYEWDLAANTYEELIELGKSLELPYEDLMNPFLNSISMYLNMEKLDAAQQKIDELLSLDFKFSVARMNSVKLKQAVIYMKNDEYKNAEKLLLEVRDSIFETTGKNSREATTVALNLSDLYASLNNKQKSMTYAKEAFDIASEILPEDHINIVLFQIQYGFKLQENDMPKEAIKQLDEGYKKLKVSSNSESLLLHAISYMLAESYAGEGDFENARINLELIEREKFQATQPSVDTDLRINVLSAILDYRQNNDLKQKAYLEQELTSLEDCSCSLLTLVRSTLGISEAMSATTE